MTSANLSEEPIAIDNDEALTRLRHIADAFLMHDREILQRCDDSVMALVDGAPQLIRRARGFVPLAVPLPFDSPPLLAVGGHLKNVFALARGRFAYQSQHLGDLENLTGLDFFREALATPDAHLRDRAAKRWCTICILAICRRHGPRSGPPSDSLPLIAVQHHHAHIAACMAEHGIEGPAIGLSLDGTGYGTDGSIWGGEVLICRLDGPDPGNSSGSHISTTCPCPAARRRFANRGAWRSAHLHAAGLRCRGAKFSRAPRRDSRRRCACSTRMIERG